MNEGEVRMAARMWSLVAEMNAETAHIEAMKADNECRRRKGEADTYGPESFDQSERNLSGIARVLREDI